TSGNLDRLNAERVPEFLLGLTERLRSQHEDLREKIRGGDWSEELQGQLREVVDGFARDFGYDLDEEGQPLEGDALPDRAGGSEPSSQHAPEAQQEAAAAA
ncbi:MAG TPA: F0F1 ATP synthase subunit alpha, partial [Solirubrobacteraceae bacterium]|nr:F0F1 ATP synthase subunit alpha [Solirubrobacteraceae bacterium]